MPISASRLVQATTTSLTCISGLTLVPSSAFAGDWTVSQKISEVTVDGDYTTAIIPAADNPAACSVPTFLRFGRSDTNYESMTAAILSAQAQGRTVRLFAAACYADGATHITGIWIQSQ